MQDGSSREGDVEREAENVLHNNIPRDSPLVVKQITKKFPGATGYVVNWIFIGAQ